MVKLSRVSIATCHSSSFLSTQHPLSSRLSHHVVPRPREVGWIQRAHVFDNVVRASAQTLTSTRLWPVPKGQVVHLMIRVKKPQK